MTNAEERRGRRPAHDLGCAAGEVANNLTFQMVAVFLLIYDTDVAGVFAGPQR